MANRSYLYSADSIPNETQIPQHVRCVSEHNWDIPLAHKIMVGHGTTIVPSMIWNPPIGIAADYAAGAALLRNLLHAVGEGLEEDTEFTECVARTTAHLEKQQAKYFILETGEIVSMSDTDPAASVQHLVSQDIPDAVANAEAAITGRNDTWLATLRTDWQTHFASFYSEALYFSFPD
ncbi:MULTISPECIES: hypothetical protein [unclassified Streptomyces]|uniref:DUF7822 domain-containing protein n=1 Tax=unclassified Streptomyces TaxID=2593676 RepID=UPI0035E1D6B3